MAPTGMRARFPGKRTFGAYPMENVFEQLSILAYRPLEAAKALNISPRHLWQLTKDGIIPCVRIGTGKRKTVLYPVADLQAWLTQQTQAQLVKGGA